MTKQQVEQKIKEILEKDKRFIGATIEIKFKDKIHTKILNSNSK